MTSSMAATATAKTQNPDTTMIHIMALDSMVNANSLFAFALFVGMFSVPINPIDPSYTLNPSCSTTNTSSHHHHHQAHNNAYYSSTMAQNLVAFHVYSFASFLFSSLVALTLKQVIKISSCSPPSSSSSGHQSTESVDYCGGRHGIKSRTITGLMFVPVNRRMLLAGILASSAGSVSGCIFLVLALVDLVQIKLGNILITCGYNLYSIAAITPLLVLVPFSLLAYICILFHAFAN